MRTLKTMHQDIQKKNMKILTVIAKTMGYIVAILIVLIIIALVVATLTNYRPSGREALLKTGKAQLAKINNDELTLLSWNIGYGGLGKEMDFFYEGGKQVRPPLENVHKYFGGIKKFLETNKETDFILLQEIDVKAKRSYWQNQVQVLGKILENHDYVFAKNYDVPFVPVPITQPMGKVLAGQVTFSLYNPATSERVSFPGDLGWPNSLFLLDRCYVIQRFITANDKVLVVINTHNSAFDKGEKRKQQLDLLKSAALKEFQSGNYVVIGGDWNLNPPDFDSTQIKNGDLASNNPAGNIQHDLFPANWTWAYDKTKPTNRFVNTSYSHGKTQTTIIDFFLLSPNIELLEVNTVDLNFEHSDHNPVKIKIILK